MKVDKILSILAILYGWMDDAILLLFNSISVISEQWANDNIGCVQWNPVYGFGSGARIRGPLDQ